MDLVEKLNQMVRDDDECYFKVQNVELHSEYVDPQDYLLQCNDCGLIDGDHIEDQCKVYFVENFLDTNSQALRRIEAAALRDKAREVRREFDRSLKPTFDCCPAHG